MKSILTASLAALAGTLLLAGCAVAPVGGPYVYGYDSYGYGQPYYYYDYGPGPGYYGYYGYYDYGPHYYGYGPAIGGTFRFGDHDHHTVQGGAHHNVVTGSSAQTAPRVSHATRSTAPTRHFASRARPSHVVPNNHIVARPNADSHS